jgi:hypothetical protein
VIKSVGSDPKMPVINSEVNYEGIIGRCWQNIQRMCFYNSVLNGTAGHTYGANGVWQMSTKEHPYGPSPHGRSWGNTPWQEAYLLPGSKQIGIGGGFMRRFRWWEFERHPEWTEPAWQKGNPYTCTAVGIPRRLRIVYMPMQWDQPLIKDLEAGVKYVAYYFDPRSGEDTPIGEVVPDATGQWRPPIPPELCDWLLVMSAS